MLSEVSCNARMQVVDMQSADMHVGLTGCCRHDALPSTVLLLQKEACRNATWKLTMIESHLQGNDIGEDRVMTFSEVREEVCRLVRAIPNAFTLDDASIPAAFASLSRSSL